MKKLLVILLSVMMFSCNNENDVSLFENNKTIPEVESNSSIKKDFFIDINEAQNLATKFTEWNNKKNGVQTYSAESNAIENVEIVESAENAKDTLMYIFNYTKGFTIVSATKEIYPILAYSDDENFNMDDLEKNIGHSIWLDYIKSYITSVTKDTATAIAKADILEAYSSLKSMFSKSQNKLETRAQYFNEIRNYIKVGPLISTNWHQNPPYNSFCPIRGGERAPVGCVPIALAQVINYYKKFDGEQIDWEKISQKQMSEITKLLQKISKSIDMVYEKEYAYPEINIPNFFDYRNRVEDFLHKKGYQTKFYELSGNKPNLCPAIYEGFGKNFIETTNWFNGHWWVMDGYESYTIMRGWGDVAIRSAQQEPLRCWSVLMLHFNFGWHESKNTWYGVGESYNGYCKNFHILEMY